MRTLVMLAMSSALLAACAGGSSGTTTSTPRADANASPAASAAAVAATPVPRSLLTPIATTAEDAVMEQTVRDCMAPALPDDVSVAASRLDACLNKGEGGFTVSGVSGTMPIVLIERPVNPTVCQSDDFIAWYPGGEWRLQFATPLLPDPVDDRLLGQLVGPGGASSIQPSAVVRQATDGLVLLSALVRTNSCGSGPGTVPMLFALEGDLWHLAWDPRWTELATLSDPQSEFTDASGIDTVHVRGALWGATGAVFFESHPGPHRYVDETWKRDGQRYVLAESNVEPSAYNTLVNFESRLSTDDDQGASALLADASLLATAKRLGMLQQPAGQQWITSLDATTQCCGPIRIAARAIDHAGPPQSIVVTFVQRGDEWLISGIAPDPGGR